MKMHKKGQGMSMNVIIIAAIALIVMVVLVVIFAGRMGLTRKTLDSCSANNGVCKPACDAESYEKQITGVCYQADGKTVDTANICCIKV